MPATGRYLTTINDLSRDKIDLLVQRARELEASGSTGARPLSGSSRTTFTAGLVFLSSSLRTRAGFAAAAARLGGAVIDVYEPRYSPGMSSAETVTDTLRTISGMVDVVVMRSATPVSDLDLPQNSPSAFINAGDASNDHPTQSLIDYWAILHERGRLEELSIAMVGDLTTRVARSLLKLFNKIPPAELLLVAPVSRRDHQVRLSAQLSSRTRESTMAELKAADVVYLCGLAPGIGDLSIGQPERLQYQINSSRLASLPDRTVVLSPMPVIDEISTDARSDHRIRLWGPSDRSVAMRMAVLGQSLR